MTSRADVYARLVKILGQNVIHTQIEWYVNQIHLDTLHYAIEASEDSLINEFVRFFDAPDWNHEITFRNISFETSQPRQKFEF